MQKLIENCEFTFECPLQLKDLAITDTDSIRFCEKCNKRVILCNTGKELRKAIKNKDCVAVHLGVMTTIGVISQNIYKKID